MSEPTMRSLIDRCQETDNVLYPELDFRQVFDRLNEEVRGMKHSNWGHEERPSPEDCWRCKFEAILGTAGGEQ